MVEGLILSHEVSLTRGAVDCCCSGGGESVYHMFLMVSATLATCLFMKGSKLEKSIKLNFYR